MGILKRIASNLGEMFGMGSNSLPAQREANIMTLQSQEAANAANRASAEKINAEQLAFSREQMASQEEFAKMGVQWKVQDAVAAGLHPLSVVGGGTPSYSPVSLNQVSSEDRGTRFNAPTNPGAGMVGQNVLQAVLRSLDPLSRAQMELAESQSDEARARAELLRSQARGSAANNPGTTVSSAAVQTFPLPDQIQAVPSRITSHKFGELQTEAGTAPFWKEYQWSPNMRILLPSSDEGPGEARENLSWYDWMTWVIPYNVRTYGPDWIPQFFEDFWGRDSTTSKWDRATEGRSSNPFRQ